MARRRGRPTKTKLQKLEDAEKRVAPAAHIVALRELFAFVTPSKGPEGRTGTIDQDICDGIGQLHALGFLNGHGYEAQDLRDKGREWRDGYVQLLRKSSYKIGGYERMDKGITEVKYTHRDARWDAMDESLKGSDRSWLLSLLVDPEVGSWPNGERNAPWVTDLIDYALLKRGKVRADRIIRFPGCEHDARLAACIRGLCSLYEASLPPRWQVERNAA